MLIRNKIIKDTIMLTVMQLILDTSALAINAYITRKIGASAIGILSLTGSFLMLAGTLSNGNAYLCTSRLISEELGKPNGNPNKILLHGVMLCGILSTAVSVILFGFSDMVGERFFHSKEMSLAVKFMPTALISGAFSACLKGYFNACRKSSVTASADILEFIAKSGVIIFLLSGMKNASDGKICRIMTAGFSAGSMVSLIFLLIVFVRTKRTFSGGASLSFGRYISFALPIMCGGVITSALSSTNDALIPITLRQYGSSVNEALSQFGVFEAIVIPAIFFPSVVLCSMSGIIVSETARAAASGNTQRLKMLTDRLVSCALIFSVFASAVLMRFGESIGNMLGGGETAGKIITVIAPVVPFIYLEIVLEALIKGMGLQGFSSLNYLAEYTVRISFVLIFVPRFGFYGIVASYYASNIIGNVSRLIKVFSHTKIRLKIFRSIILPILYAFMTLKASELILRPIENSGLVYMIILTALWAFGYCAVFITANKAERYTIYTKTINHIDIKCRKSL